MKQRHRHLLCLLFCGLTTALADAAPPQQFPGSSISTTIKTNVQMAAEQVVLTLVPRKPSANDDYRWKTVVQADFQMKGGPKTEKMTVRFPLEDPSGLDDGIQITDLKAFVNGKEVPTRLVASKGEDDQTVSWAGFEVTFPAHQVTRLRITYSALPQSPFGDEPTVLAPGYILETGAGWAGKIGRADLTLKLPYQASANTVLRTAGSYAPYFNGGDTTPGATFRGNEVHWTFKNLEPTAKDNLNVIVLNPTLVAQFEQAKKKAASGTTSDLLAWAKASSNLMVTDPTEIKAWQQDPYTLHYLKAVQAMEKKAAREPEVRLAVLEAITSLPSMERFGYWSSNHPELLRAITHLEALRKAGNTRALPLMTDLQWRLGATLVLPSQKAAQAEVTAEQTIGSLTKAAQLVRYPAGDRKEKIYEREYDCQTYISSLTPPQVLQRLDGKLFSLGRTWLNRPDAPGGAIWESGKVSKAGKLLPTGTTVHSNSFTSVNNKRVFRFDVWSTKVGGQPKTLLCITQLEHQWPG